MIMNQQDELGYVKMSFPLLSTDDENLHRQTTHLTSHGIIILPNILTLLSIFFGDMVSARTSESV